MRPLLACSWQQASARHQYDFSILRISSHLDKIIIGRLGHGALKNSVFFSRHCLPPFRLGLSAQVKKRHQEKYYWLYGQHPKKQRLAKGFFQDGSAIASLAPKGLQRCIYLSLTHATTKPDYISKRLKTYEERFRSWANGVFKNV